MIHFVKDIGVGMTESIDDFFHGDATTATSSSTRGVAPSSGIVLVGIVMIISWHTIIVIVGIASVELVIVLVVIVVVMEIIVVVVIVVDIVAVVFIVADLLLLLLWWFLW